MEDKIPLSVFLSAIGIGMTFIGAFIWRLFDSVQELKRHFSSLEVNVAENCVKKGDMQLILKEFKEDNRQIFNEIKAEMRTERQEIMSAIGKKQDRT